MKIEMDLLLRHGTWHVMATGPCVAESACPRDMARAARPLAVPRRRPCCSPPSPPPLQLMPGARVSLTHHGRPRMATNDDNGGKQPSGRGGGITDDVA
jgi:hypothetical protein